MELHNLKPAKGSSKNKKRLVEEKDPVEVVLLQEDIKEQNPDQDIEQKKF